MPNQKSNKGKKSKRTNSSGDEQENGACAAATGGAAAAAAPRNERSNGKRGNGQMEKFTDAACLHKRGESSVTDMHCDVANVSFLSPPLLSSPLPFPTVLLYLDSSRAKLRSKTRQFKCLIDYRYKRAALIDHDFRPSVTGCVLVISCVCVKQQVARAPTVLLLSNVFLKE